MRFRMQFILTITGLIFFISSNSSHAASIVKPEPFLPGQSWKYLKASEFVSLSAKEFSRLTGKKMNLSEKISFDLLKQKMKQELKKRPALTVNEYFNKVKKKMSTGLLILLIIIGALLIAFLIFALAYGGAF